MIEVIFLVAMVGALGVLAIGILHISKQEK